MLKALLFNAWNVSVMIKLLLSFAFNFYLCRYSLSNTFAGATAFNQPLTGWDTARVTDMRSMFAFTPAFNGAGLVGWDTSSVLMLVGRCKLEVYESCTKTQKLIVFAHEIEV